MEGGGNGGGGGASGYGARGRIYVRYFPLLNCAATNIFSVLNIYIQNVEFSTTAPENPFTILIFCIHTHTHSVKCVTFCFWVALKTNDDDDDDDETSMTTHALQSR